MVSFDRPIIYCPECKSANITHTGYDSGIVCDDCEYEETEYDEVEECHIV